LYVDVIPPFLQVRISCHDYSNHHHDSYDDRTPIYVLV
jgi:hypothetical protein